MKTLKILSLVLLAFFTSCESDDNAMTGGNMDGMSNNDDNAGFISNFGTSINANFFGAVNDTSGNPIDGVSISVGGQTITTDVNRVFSINAATVNEQFAYVKASKAGFIDGSRSVIPSINAASIIKITMIPMHVTATVASGAPSFLLNPLLKKYFFLAKAEHWITTHLTRLTVGKSKTPDQ